MLQEIIVLSSVEKPKIALEGDGTLFFKPTCVGSSSERTYIIKNVTRLPLRFEWKIQSIDSMLLSVTPHGGIIQPNESQVSIIIRLICYLPTWLVTSVSLKFVDGDTVLLLRYLKYFVLDIVL